MAYHSKSEIAKLTGKSIAHVSVNVKRGVLIMSGDHIDDTIPKNAAVIKRWKAQEDAKKEEKSVKKTKETLKKDVKVGKKPDFKPDKPSKNQQVKADFTPPENPKDTYEDLNSLDNQKKIADINHKKAQILKEELVAQRIRGESIPIVMVSAIISSLGSSFQRFYKNGAESLIMDLSHKYKIPDDAALELNKKLIDLINESHDKSINASKNDLKNVISEVKNKKPTSSV